MVSVRVLVAGATGAVGRVLVPQLRARGHHVTALVRRDDQVSAADDVAVADVLEGDRLTVAVKAAAPDVVVHQLSGYGGCDPATGIARTARVRRTGTRNLVTAAVAAGARRMVVQSSVAACEPCGHDVLDEEAPLWTDAPGAWGDAVRAVAEMEQAVLTNPGIEGVALRYGELYGPRTAYAPGGRRYEQVRDGALPMVEDGMGIMSFTHVEDAAGVVAEVLAGAEPGSYNVVDNEPAESSEWLPTYARMVDGPEPVSLTLQQAHNQLDWLTVHQLTEQRGATNFRLRETTGWRPLWPSWREGFATLLNLWPG